MALQVDADLVGAPRLQPQPQQRGALEGALEREVRARLARLAPPTAMRVRTRGSRPIGASIVPERAGGRPSTSARYSRSINRSAERRLQQPVRLLAAGDHEQARGVAVEPVHDPRALGLAAGRRSRASSWASVTSRCPRAGCTTSPGPLSTTIRCSSS